MKKTITLLLAAAGLAMGATDITNQLDWTNNTIQLSDFTSDFNTNNNSITIAMTLDWHALIGIEKHRIISIQNNNGSNGVGVGYVGKHKTDDLNLTYIDINGDFYTDKNKYGNGYESVATYPTITDCVLIFTNSGITTTDFKAWLYVWSDSDTPNVYATNYTKDTGLEKLEQIVFASNYRDYADNIHVYMGIVDDIDALATTTKNASIPEPTTATLSLLALAGLAARRRR